MIDINAALGMVERPLQVGDWVECVDVGDWQSLSLAKWPQRVRFVDAHGRVSFDDRVGPWSTNRFRRVDPPRDEVAELREQVRILNEICDDIRDTFGYSRDDMVDLTTYVAEDYAELKEQLSQATKERDELKLQVENDRVVIEEMNRQADQWSKRYRDVRGERDEAREILGLDVGRSEETLTHIVAQLREQLATVQAEAAAMRNAIELAGEGLAEYADGSEILHDADCPQDDTCDCAHLRKLTEAQRLMHKCINGTAGREWLDRHKAEIAAKDAEIEAYKVETARLRKMWMDYDGLIVRLERKCRTAKVALVETYRGKIDGAWFGETEPIYWQMPEDNQCTWRCIDGQRLQVRFNGGEWEAAFAYSSVSEIDKYLPRCNADGTPLEKPLTQTADISETSGVKDAALLRKLREWIRNGVFTVVGNSVVIGCQCIPTELAELLISIRDGGAK